MVPVPALAGIFYLGMTQPAWGGVGGCGLELCSTTRFRVTHVVGVRMLGKWAANAYFYPYSTMGS